MKRNIDVLEYTQLLLEVAECNKGNIFRVSHILRHNLKWLQIMKGEESISQYCTRQCTITTL